MQLKFLFRVKAWVFKQVFRESQEIGFEHPALCYLPLGMGSLKPLERDS